MGFHRPRSLVICRGCLLFFTLLAIGVGFIIIVRGGVRAFPDFVTCIKKHRRHRNISHNFTTVWTNPQDPMYGTFFFSLDEGSLPEQRTGSITGGPLTRLDDFTRLLSTSSSSNFFLFIDLRRTILFRKQPVMTQHCHVHKNNTIFYFHVYFTSTTPGGTSAFGNTTPKCLCCCPFHVFNAKRLFILRPTLSTSYCNGCTNHWVACLHLFTQHTTVRQRHKSNTPGQT